MACLHHHTISLLFLLILSSAQLTQLRFMAEGRAIHNRVGISQAGNEEKKVIVRGQIGSRPPRCERRCSSCGHCEAIQVPANPQVKSGNKNSSSVASTIAYARGDENSSNYKPMSWKCKCGNSIFNP
ncbi:PREDICTED: EPIDERMAL PATTERNING FACTOR-like protein 2 [Prunus mume]|nr:PREDICTED: EPIDERMAL PATTERNING FACTOR-like protein 2 [Prunus mume]